MLGGGEVHAGVVVRCMLGGGEVVQAEADHWAVVGLALLLDHCEE